MGKEIVINKNRLKKNLDWVLIAFLYSVVLMFFITILFGRFVYDKSMNIREYSPKFYHKYYNKLLDQEYYGYIGMDGWEKPDDLELPIIILDYYIPFVFIENFLLLIIMTAVLTVILKLSNYFTIKFK